jgi:hypothetical protein
MKNIGIYALYWWSQDLVYIGLSQNLCDRKREHLYKLSKGTHTNYKVQNAYNLYGNPEFIIIETCSISELPHKEVYWTNEFDALNTGLCLVEPGIVGFGTNSNASKYGRVQILKVFSLLYQGILTYSEISLRTKVNKGTIADICSGRVHLWLQEQYPTKYQHMCTIKNRAYKKHLNIKKAELIKDNILYEVYGVKEFCRNILGNETFSSAICRVINGTRNSCKGFRLHKSF